MKKSFKLATIGTHGIGKTTIAHGLSFILKLKGFNVELVTEVARTSPLPINENTTLESQLWIVSTQKKREIEAVQRAEVVICDRSLLDNYAYYQSTIERANLTDLYPSTWYEVQDWMKTYNLLIYLKPDIPLIDDGIRSINQKFQQEIDDKVYNLIRDYELATESNLPLLHLSASELQCQETIFRDQKALDKILEYFY